MSDFDANAPLDVSDLGVYKSTTPELIVVNRRAFEATTNIGQYYYLIFCLWSCTAFTPCHPLNLLLRSQA